MGIPASRLSYFNAITAMPSEQRHNSGLEIAMEIRCNQQWSFATNNDHVHKMPPKSIADKWRCCNLPKGKEAVSVIIFRDIPHSIPRSELP
jgi:hypothetical protein